MSKPPVVSNNLPEALVRNPRISTWLRFEEHHVLLCTGKVELGQGITTALALIAAEELDVDPGNIRVQTGRTTDGPREFPTVGSMSIEGSGSAIRRVAAEARAVLLSRAAARFGVPASTLTVDNGNVYNPAGNEQVSYFSLAGDDPIDETVTGDVNLKAPASYRHVGSRGVRRDLPAKLDGGRAFIQDMAPADVRHARVIRGKRSTDRLISIDDSRARLVPGIIDVIVDGSFVAVVADDEHAARVAAARVRVTWEPDGTVDTDTISFLRTKVSHTLLVEDGTPTDGEIPPAALPEDGTLTRATYTKPYHLHGAMAPSAAIATWKDDHLMVISHSQGPALLRLAIAEALDLERRQVSVQHAENAGCYGHNGADDAAMDASLIAWHRPGETILLKWEREQEHLHEPFSTAMVVDLAGRMVDGRITHWHADVFSQTHNGRPFQTGDGKTTLLAAQQKSGPLEARKPLPGLAPHGGIHRNADPGYNVGRKRITKNLVDDATLRTSSTRALGAFANVFAIESFMDELAHAAGQDPLAVRLAHHPDPRARAVIEVAVAKLTSYEVNIADNQLAGKGLAYARYKNAKCYAAVGVVVCVNEETLDVTIEHAVISADAGQVIDSDGLTNQLEGGFIQAASWTLIEAVHLDASGSLSTDWDSYPILRFDEIPTVETHLIDQPLAPPLGAGEATAGPTPAAIANAVFNATGIRIRNLPITADALREAALSG